MGKRVQLQKPYSEFTDEEKRRKVEVCKKYEKSEKGFLVRLYRNMKSRITGVQKEKFHLYENKELLPKDEFYAWALSHPDFHNLFRTYEASGYDRALAPSVDRKNPAIGYVISNMRWLTHSENSALTSRNRAVEVNGELLPSLKDVATRFNIPYKEVVRSLREGRIVKQLRLAGISSITYKEV